MSTLIHRFKTILLKIKNAVFPNFSFTWKIHLMKDFLGTKVWTKTSEVVTPLGFKLTSGYHPAYHLMRIGQFEVDETDVITRVLKQIDIFVDIGANLGYYTCLALQNKKHVIAFEPQQQNLDCLYKNLTINHWQSNAEIFPIALSDTPGLLTLYGASGPSASLIKNWAGYSSSFSKTVSINTLDNILLSRFLDKKLFIKIDVEGAEYSVLKGAINTISRLNKPIWLIEVCLDEFHPQGKNPDYLDIFNLFWANGYKAFTASKNIQLVNDHEIKGWFDAGKSQSGTFNYLFAESSELLNFN